MDAGESLPARTSLFRGMGSTACREVTVNRGVRGRFGGFVIGKDEAECAEVLDGWINGCLDE